MIPGISKSTQRHLTIIYRTLLFLIYPWPDLIFTQYVQQIRVTGYIISNNCSTRNWLPLNICNRIGRYLVIFQRPIEMALLTAHPGCQEDTEQEPIYPVRTQCGKLRKNSCYV